MANFKHIAIAGLAALSIASFAGSTEAARFGGMGHGMSMGHGMGHGIGYGPHGMGHMAYRGDYGRYGHHHHHGGGYFPYYAFAAVPYYDDYWYGDDDYYAYSDCYWRHGRRYCTWD